MGNIECKTLSTFINHEERDPTARVERLINLEKNSLEEKLTSLRREPDTESALAQIAQHEKLLEAINYFTSSGGIIKSQKRLEQEVQQIQLQLSQSKQEKQKLEQSLSSSVNRCLNQEQQLTKVRQEEIEAKETIEALTFQIQSFQEESQKEQQQYLQLIKFNKDNNNRLALENQLGIINHEQALQNDLNQIFHQEQSKINQKGQQHFLLQNQFDQVNQDILYLQEQIRQDEVNHQKQIAEIQRQSSEQLKKQSQQMENKFNSELNNTLQKKQNDWNQQKQALETQITNLKIKIKSSQETLN